MKLSHEKGNGSKMYFYISYSSEPFCIMNATFDAALGQIRLW